jgi:cytochrome c556
MMNVKWVALFLLLVGVLGWSAQDKKKGPKSKEVQKTYASLMEEVGKENKAIKNVEAASKLDYLKGEEEDLDRFKACFEVFLDIRMKQLTEATWDEKTSENLYERLQSSCRTCHELFRDE